MVAQAADVVVVGGGLAGLLVAGLLAGSGHRVTVLEARPVLGGRARSTDHGSTDGGGFRLNLGPRALYRGPTRSALRRLGVRPAGGPPPVKAASALFEGRLHPGFMTVGGLLTTSFLAYRDRAALAAALGLVRARPALAAITAAEWLDTALPSQRSRMAATALIRVATYLGAPELASADAVVGHLATARLGVRYVDGGWQSLVDALHRRLTRSGVTVLAGRRVTALETGGGRHVLTTADGLVTAARAVVIAGLPPARAAALLGRPVLAERVGPPLHAACLDVALRRLPDPRRLFIYGVDEPLYLVVHSTHARLGPPGGAVVHLVRYDDGTPPPTVATRARLEALLDSHQPGWRAHLAHIRYLPRMVVTNGLPVAGAGLAGRPEVSVPGRPGVFLAGDWVGRVGLLADAAAASAVRAAAAADRHLEAVR